MDSRIIRILKKDQLLKNEDFRRILLTLGQYGRNRNEYLFWKPNTCGNFEVRKCSPIIYKLQKLVKNWFWHLELCLEQLQGLRNRVGVTQWASGQLLETGTCKTLPKVSKRLRNLFKTSIFKSWSFFKILMICWIYFQNPFQMYDVFINPPSSPWEMAWWQKLNNGD